jgi:hypothetical protein
MQNVRMTLYAPHNGSLMHSDAHEILKAGLFSTFKGYTLSYGTGTWLNPITNTEEWEPVLIYTVITSTDNYSMFEDLAKQYKELAGQHEVLYVIEECQARSI